MEKIIRFGDLFCGPGGIALGLLKSTIVDNNQKRWRFKHAFALDKEKSTCLTYAKNICDNDSSHVYCKDVGDIDFSALPDIKLLSFGFPCNDYSMVGKRLGINGKYGPLYSYGIRILKEKQPDVFIAENVKGLKGNENGKILDRIIDEMTGAGYEVTPHLYKFEEYMVPQCRHRIVIVGIHKSKKLTFKVPAPPKNHREISVREALAKTTEGLPNNNIAEPNETVKRRLALIPEGKNAWFLDEMLDLSDETLKQIIKTLPHRKDWSPARIRQEIREVKLNVKSARMSQIYKRLSADRPSYTITGSGGGGTHVYHWKENRALTNREKARLQTFPDNFLFCGSESEVRQQIGMAVPPKGITFIGNAILKTLAGIKYRSIESSLR